MLTLLPLLGLMALFFLWGFFVARARGRSALMWGIACAVTFFIGIAILYSLGKRTPLPSRKEHAQSQDVVLLDNPRLDNTRLARPDPRTTTPEFSRPADIARYPARIDNGENTDDRRWRYLSEYHPEVRKALAAVSHLGDDAVQELKAAHLSVGDAAVLPAIVQRIGERFGGNNARSYVNGAGSGRAVTSLSQGTDNIPSQPASEGLGLARTHARPQNRALDNDDEEEPLMLDAPVAVQDPTRRPASLNGSRSLSLAAPATAASILVSDTDSMPALTVEHAPVQDDGERDDDALVASPLAHDDDDTDPDAPPKDEDRADERQAGGTQADIGGAGDTARQSGTAGGAAAANSLNDRTAVTPADLVGARFLETYASVHLFGLADGRVFIDRHEARPNVELARNYVDQVAARRSLG